MILDDTLVLSDAQAITASAASTNIIDLGATGTAFGHAAALARDVGKGPISIPIIVNVVETFATLTSLQVALQVDDDAAFGSPTTIATGPAIAAATLVAGYRFTFPAELPEGTSERYLRLNYTVAGTNASAGKITAAIVAGRQTN